ncbi:glycosyltransferase family 39 protein [bacterium]|nr:glycosyltransferase family 39 protein [bacterium]MCI0605234.1 glycosyltransferase family 39 protein [bacterium]
MNLKNLLTSIPRPSKSVLLLFLLIAIGSYLRLKALDFQSLWMDELNTMIESDPDKNFEGVLFHLRRGTDRHPPLYHLIVHYWFQLVGYNAYTARFLSAIVGITTIPAIYVLGKELYNRRVGLICAAFTAFNFYSIFYSQEARAYIFAFLFTSVSFFFFIRALRDPSWKGGLLYGLATSLLVYTHYFGFFIILSQLVTVLIFLNRRLLRPFLICFGAGFVLMFILYLPWMHTTVTVATAVSSSWIEKPKADFFVTYFWDYFGQDPFTVYFFAFLLIVFLGGGILFRTSQETPEDIRENRYLFSFVVLLTWIAVSYLVPYVKSVASLPLLFNRYTIVTLPAILLAAAIGVDLLHNPLVKKYLVVLILSFSLIHLFVYSRYYEKPTRTQWRELIAFVVEKNPENYPIISDRAWYMAYYFKAFGGAPRYVKEKEIPHLTDVWVVTGHQGKPLSDKATELLKRDFKMKAAFVGIGTWAQYYSRKNTGDM